MVSREVFLIYTMHIVVILSNEKIGNYQFENKKELLSFCVDLLYDTIIINKKSIRRKLTKEPGKMAKKDDLYCMLVDLNLFFFLLLLMN